MKIRTQEANKVLEFGEGFVEKRGYEGGVFIRGRYGRDTVLAGIYEDESRAKGVLQEILYAYEIRKPVFYMPLE